MDSLRIAVLGGDRREYRIGELLAADGHDVVLHAVPAPPDGVLAVAPTAAEAVAGAHWLVCPSPGLGEGDVLYAPGADAPVALDEALLARTRAAEGGIVLGRATPSLTAVAGRLGIALHEMKDDRSLAVRNATPVAEAVAAILVQSTDQILRELDYLVVGYGATGAAITDVLLGLACPVTVAARSSEARARAEQRGARAVDYAARAASFGRCDVVITTVPDTEAVPSASYAELKDRLVIDIASPPGGLDHDAARAAGVDVTWARGLAGGRAPLTVGAAQYALVRAAIAGAGAPAL